MLVDYRRKIKTNPITTSFQFSSKLKSHKRVLHKLFSHSRAFWWLDDSILLLFTIQNVCAVNFDVVSWTNSRLNDGRRVGRRKVSKLYSFSHQLPPAFEFPWRLAFDEDSPKPFRRNVTQNNRFNFFCYFSSENFSFHLAAFSGASQLSLSWALPSQMRRFSGAVTCIIQLL